MLPSSQSVLASIFFPLCRRNEAPFDRGFDLFPCSICKKPSFTDLVYSSEKSQDGKLCFAWSWAILTQLLLQFLLIWRMLFPIHTFLASVDVNSLYTNVCYEDGVILKCKPAVNKCIVQTLPTIDLVWYIKLMFIVHNFEFNRQHYIQTRGTAVGTTMARPLIYDHLEEKRLPTAPFK